MSSPGQDTPLYKNIRWMIDLDGPVVLYAEGLVRASGGAAVFGTMGLFATYWMGLGPILPFALASCFGFVGGWWHTYATADRRLDYALKKYPAIVRWHLENQMPELFVDESAEAWVTQMRTSRSFWKRQYCLGLNRMIFQSIRRQQEAQLEQILAVPPPADSDTN